MLVAGRAMRTHGLNDLLVPTKELALAIAAEFALQRDVVLPSLTPLYNLVSVAIDTFQSDDELTATRAPAIDAALRASGRDVDAMLTVTSSDEPVPTGGDVGEQDMSVDGNRPEVRYGPVQPGGAGLTSIAVFDSETRRLVELAKDYLETDTVCYRVPVHSGDPDEALLRQRQDRHYQELLDWFARSFGVELAWTEGFGAVNHPTAAYEVLEDIIDSADPYARAALRAALGTCKSTVIALALMSGHLTVEQAVAASRVEEEYQIEINGFVEDGHDTARVQTQVKLASAAGLMWLHPGAALAAPTGDNAEVQQQLRDRLLRVAARRRRDEVLKSMGVRGAAQRELDAARSAIVKDAAITQSETGLSAEDAQELASLRAQLTRMQEQQAKLAARAHGRSPGTS